MLCAVIVLVTVIYGALLYITLQHNLAEINQDILDTAWKNAASLVAFVDHAGFRERILGPQPAIENISYFRQVSSQEIDAQRLPDFPAGSSWQSGNPFQPGTPMYDFTEQVRLFTQVSFDIEMLLFHVPGNDYYIGAEDGGRSIVVAHGAQAAAGAIALEPQELQRLIQGNDLAVTSSGQDSLVQDKIVFSVDIGQGITILLSARQNVLNTTIMNANYGRQFHPVGVALLHQGEGVYWLSDPAGYALRQDFLGLGDTDWASMPELYTIQNGGHKLVVLNYEMDTGYHFRHVVIIEQSGYLLMNRHNVTLLTILTLLWIIACGVIGLILYQEWYAPISRILDQMPPGSQAQDAPARDEYVAIASGIESMYREIDSNHAAISQHRDMLRRALLSRMIHSPGEQPARPAAVQYGLPALLKRYALAVFLPDTPSGSEDKEREDALAALEADVNQRLLPGEEAILLSQQNQAVLLLSSAAKTDDALTPLLMDCLPSISQAYSSPLRFCCSGFVQDPSPHAAYTRALLAPAILYPPDPEEQASANAAYKSRMRLSYKLALFACLDAHQYKKALEPFKQILDTIFEETISLPLRFSLLSGLSGDLYCRILETDEGAKSLLDSMPMQYPNGEVDGKDDILSQWASLFSSLQEARQRNPRYSPLFTQIACYMAEHYQENDLSLTKLAGVFGVGTATISREFKKNCESGFLEYLHRLRIGAAKERIRSTDAPLKDIAPQVGYDNVLTMTRAFKKYEGATPGAFRDS